MKYEPINFFLCRHYEFHVTFFEFFWIVVIITFICSFIYDMMMTHKNGIKHLLIFFFQVPLSWRYFLWLGPWYFSLPTVFAPLISTFRFLPLSVPLLCLVNWTVFANLHILELIVFTLPIGVFLSVAIEVGRVFCTVKSEFIAIRPRIGSTCWNELMASVIICLSQDN